MSIQNRPPPVTGFDWKPWAERLVDYLSRIQTKLMQQTGRETASDDGLLMWDRETKSVVVSRSGEFCGLTYNDRLLAYTTATHSAASANTAYAITWENESLGNHIYVDDTNTSRIYFEHAGTYKIDFSCELQSQNLQFKTIYIFPAINGTDVSYSTIVQSLRNANDSFTVTRSGIFQMEAGDYLEAKFAVDNTNLWIEGSAATAFSPAAPSAVIIIHGV